MFMLYVFPADIISIRNAPSILIREACKTEKIIRTENFSRTLDFK